MKVIVSHDVDHIGVREHCFDGMVEKHIIRSTFEFMASRIKAKEFFERFRSIAANRWHNLNSMMDFDESAGIPSTFFWGMTNGLGLAYSREQAQKWISIAETRGFETGVHGIAYNDIISIKKEKDAFATCSRQKSFGIRMHYLRQSSQTSRFLEEVGYLYDATPYTSGFVSKMGRMFVFPIHAMESTYLRSGPLAMQVRDIDAAVSRVVDTIKNAANSGIEYFSLLFHDRYFSEEFAGWKKWYIVSINALKAEGCDFVGYLEAINSLRKKDV